MIRLAPLMLLFAVGLSGSGAADPTRPAREIFGSFAAPVPATPARVIGGYSRGCIAGANVLPADGDGWQVMRPSRNRAWAHPTLIAFIERLSLQARADGWHGLLVGDMAQPRGGPMRTGHASHQIGLDVDLWLMPMPDYRLTVQQREEMGAVSMLREGSRTADPARLGPAQMNLIRRAALDPEVARIFVHPGIKQAICRRAGTDRGWLRKIRPWWGHDAHFHVRLRCPADQPLCREQEPPPPGDGCGADLAWWLSDEPWRPKPPGPPEKPIMLADLPQQCAAITAVP
jgi:penicillin-insensitive murein endopeptidase